jgi:CHAD domain-containing protein
VRETLERELKLEADDDFLLPDLDGTPLEPRVFTSTYHDTPQRSLARAGITLRRRLEHGLGLWQLKLPVNGARIELEEPGAPAGPPETLARLLAAHLRHGDLEPVAVLRTRRTGLLVEHPASAEVVVDEVAVLDGQRVVASFREVEVELLDGDAAALEQIGRTLRSAGAKRGDAQPKVFRVIGKPPRPPRDHAIRARIRAQLEEILAHDPGTRLGGDPESLHDFRVAVRRLRALLRTIRPLVDASRTEPLRDELKWLGGVLGDVRDLDVLLEHLRGELTALGTPESTLGAEALHALESERDAKRDALLEALATDRYFALLDLLEQTASTLEVGAKARMRKLAAKEFRRLRRDVKAGGAEPSDPVLHEIRKRAKKARYAAELVGGGSAARFVAETKALQDVLGEHNDAIVAEQRLHTLYAGGAARDSAFALGRLFERERVRAARTRAAWPDAWRRVRDSGRAAWK